MHYQSLLNVIRASLYKPEEFKFVTGNHSDISVFIKNGHIMGFTRILENSDNACLTFYRYGLYDYDQHLLYRCECLFSARKEYSFADWMLMCPVNRFSLCDATLEQFLSPPQP
ncbi:hypothetical protein [Pantoea sp. A4]|uniref:hypothetical protein n=1 Tax=Pantoea sp. A4 TaxID=1225184 RepID=UPI000373D80C|nr:hypothetical protein [Pantoea sp. A4]